ncbi:MAG TPA: hypothetical protein VK572_10895 [Burkholderiales bacterium]|nr:hypothetical protein [Burkholderiales bacterium]
MTKTRLAALLAVLIAGCANEQVLLTNEKGDRRYCNLVYHGAFSRIAATAEFNRCLNEAGAAGFKREN